MAAPEEMVGVMNELASHRFQVFGLLNIPPEVNAIWVNVRPPGLNHALFLAIEVPGPSFTTLSFQMEIKSFCDCHRAALRTPLLILRSLKVWWGEGGSCPPMTPSGSWHGSPEEYYWNTG